MVYITESILNANSLLVEIQYTNLSSMISQYFFELFNNSCWVATKKKPPHNSTSTKNISFA